MSVQGNSKKALGQPLLAAAPLSTADAAAAPMSNAEHSKNQLATLNGVFVPCSLNIMGIILFLRFGWGVGQAGVLGVLGVLAIAFTLATLTVLSFSTIVTNGVRLPRAQTSTLPPAHQRVTRHVSRCCFLHPLPQTVLAMACPDWNPSRTRPLTTTYAHYHFTPPHRTSSLCQNMAGGGSYFMISRSLGPEFGGAIGILFYLAYAVGVCFYGTSSNQR